jgi:hypothetical protein
MGLGQKCFVAGLRGLAGNLLASGGYRVRELGPDGEGALTTEALVLDRRRKTYASYYNTGCCYYSPPRRVRRKSRQVPSPPGTRLVPSGEVVT